MPIEGIPNSSKHRFCRRCHKWFVPEEGATFLPEATGPRGSLQALRISAIGKASDFQFQCTRCTRVRRITQVIIWLLFLTLIQRGRESFNLIPVPFFPVPFFPLVQVNSCIQ